MGRLQWKVAVLIICRPIPGPEGAFWRCRVSKISRSKVRNNQSSLPTTDPSQGKNSLAPMRAAIKALRTRLGPDHPIFVVHIDQAANDFNTLFDANAIR